MNSIKNQIAKIELMKIKKFKPTKDSDEFRITGDLDGISTSLEIHLAKNTNKLLKHLIEELNTENKTLRRSLSNIESNHYSKKYVS